MAYSDVEFAFSLQSLSREVEQQRFCQLRAWTEPLQRRDSTALRILFRSLTSEYAELFQSKATTPAVYGVLLMLAEAFRLSLAADQPDLQLVAYIVGLGIEHSLSPEEERVWGEAYHASGRTRLSPMLRFGYSTEYKYPDLSGLPMKLVRGLARHNRIDLARSLLKYAYFEYRIYYERLLADSSDQDRWHHNLLELTARLTMPMRVPVSMAPVFKPPFMPSDEAKLLSNEHLEILRLLGCVDAALRHWSPDPQSLSHYKAEAHGIVVRKGRAEARGYLDSLYHHTLEIPTYAYQAFSDALRL